MIAIAYLGTLLITAILIAVVFQRVLVKTLNRNVNKDPKPVSELGDSLERIFLDLALLILEAAQFFQLIFSAVVFNILTNYKIYTIVFATCLLVEGNTSFHPQFYQTADYISTNFGQPFYQEVCLTTFNALRAIYNVMIPWYNAVAYIQRFAYLEPFKVWVACSSQDWQSFINSIVASIQSTFTSIGNFIGSQGDDDLDVSGPLGYITSIFGDFKEAWVCTCADFSFMTTIQADIIQLSSYHDSIDRVLNLIIAIIRSILQPCLQLITNGPNLFLCTEGNSTQILQCQLNRPPIFRRDFTIRDQLMIRFFDMIDDVIAIFFNVFFGLTSDEIPRFGPILSGALNGITEMQYLIFNTIVHIDLVFGPTNFLQYSDLNAPLVEFFNISHGLEQFWGTWQQNFTDDIGGFQASLFNISLDTFNFTMLFARELFTDTNNIKSFLETYDTSLFQRDLISATLFADALASQINDQLGHLVQRLIYAAQAFFNAIVFSIVHIQQFPGNTQLIINEFDIYFQALNATAIQLGNCLRQYDLPNCPLVDPDMIPPMNPVNELAFSCQFGNFLQSLFIVFVDFIALVSDTIADLIINGFTQESLGKIISTGPLNFGLTLIPELTQVADSIAGMFAAPFNDAGTCPYFPDGVPNPPNTIALNFRNVIFSFGNFTIGLLYDGNVVIQTIGVLLAPDQFNPPPQSCPTTGPLNLQEIMLCNMILTFYDSTIGNLGFIAISIYDTGVCLFGPDVSSLFTIAKTIWQDFGWDYSQSFRFQICCILKILENAFNLIFGIFTGNATMVYNALIGVLEPIICPINFLITAIDQVIGDINLLPSIFTSVFTSLGDCIGDAFKIIPGCIGSCVTYPFNCGSCGTPSSCSFNPPTFPPITPPDFSSCPSITVRKRNLGGYTDPIWFFDIVQNENGSFINPPDIYTKENYWFGDPLNGSCGALLLSLRAYNVENKTETLGIRLMLKNDLVMCYVSYRTAYLINTGFLAPDESQRIVDDDFLYDKVKLFHTVYSFIKGSYYIAVFQIYKHTGLNSNVTSDWETYVIENDLSPVTKRFGYMVDTVFSLENQINTKSPLAGVMQLYGISWRYTLGTWNNYQIHKQEHLQRRRNIAHDKRFETWESTFSTLSDVYINSNEIAPYKQALNDSFQHYSSIIINKWVDMNQKADKIPRVARNRYGAMLVWKKASSIWNELFSQRKRREPKNPMDRLIVKRNENDLSMRQSFSTPNFSLWDPCIVVDGVNLCFNCSVINNIIATMIETLIEAYLESEEAINTQAIFFESETRYITNAQDSMSFNIMGRTIPLHPHVWGGPGYVIRNGIRINVTNNSPHFDALKSLREDYMSTLDIQSFPIPNQGIGVNFNRIPIDLISWVSTYDILDALAFLFTFISNTNTSDPQGLFFWMFFLLNCDYNSGHLCLGNALFSGLGLPTSIAVTTVTLVVLAFVIEVIIGIGLTLAIVLLILYPILCLTLAYGTSPFCLTTIIASNVPEIGYFPVVLPIIQNCLANDLFVFLQYFNRDCIAFENFLPGITSLGCGGGPVYIPNPTPQFASGAIRQFVDCNSSPYSFYDGIRNLFFALEYWEPSVNQFLLTTDLVLFSWIRQVGFVSSAIEFPFSGNPPDVWISCFNLTSPNFWNLLIVILILAFLLLIFLLLFITVFVLITDILFAIILIFTELIGVASGSYTLSGTKYNSQVAHNYGVQPNAKQSSKKKKNTPKFIDQTTETGNKKDV